MGRVPRSLRRYNCVERGLGWGGGQLRVCAGDDDSGARWTNTNKSWTHVEESNCFRHQASGSAGTTHPPTHTHTPRGTTTKPVPFPVPVSAQCCLSAGGEWWVGAIRSSVYPSVSGVFIVCWCYCCWCWCGVSLRHTTT